MLTITNAVNTHFPPFNLKPDIRGDQHLPNQSNAHALAMPLIPSPQRFYDASLASFQNVSSNPTRSNSTIHMFGSIPVQKQRFGAPLPPRQPITVSAPLSQNLIAMKAPLTYLYDTGSTKQVDTILYRDDISTTNSSGHMPFLSGRTNSQENGCHNFVPCSSFPILVTSSSPASSFISFKPPIKNMSSSNTIISQTSSAIPTPTSFLSSTKTSIQTNFDPSSTKQAAIRSDEEGMTSSDIRFNPQNVSKEEQNLGENMIWEPHFDQDNLQNLTSEQETPGTESCSDEIMDGQGMISVSAGMNNNLLSAKTAGEFKGISLRHSIESILKMDNNSQNQRTELMVESDDKTEDFGDRNGVKDSDMKREHTLCPNDTEDYDDDGDDDGEDDDNDDNDNDGNDGGGGSSNSNYDNDNYDTWSGTNSNEDNDDDDDNDDESQEVGEDGEDEDTLSLNTSQNVIDEEECIDESNNETIDVNNMDVIVDVATIDVDDDQDDLDVEIIAHDQDSSCQDDLRLSSGLTSILDTSSQSVKTKHSQPMEEGVVKEIRVNDCLTKRMPCRPIPDTEQIPGDIFDAESKFRMSHYQNDHSDNISHPTSEHLNRNEVLISKKDNDHFQKDDYFQAKINVLDSMSKTCEMTSIHHEEKLSINNFERSCRNEMKSFPSLPPFQSLLPTEHTPNPLPCPSLCQSHLDTQHHVRSQFNHLLQSTQHQMFLNTRDQRQEEKPQNVFKFLEEESQRSAFKPIAKNSLPATFNSMHFNNQCKPSTRAGHLDPRRLPIHTSTSGYLDRLFNKPTDETNKMSNSSTTTSMNHSIDECINLDAISLLRLRSNNFQCPGSLPASFTYSSSTRSNPDAVRAWLAWLRARNPNTIMNESIQPMPSVMTKAPPPRYHCGDCNKTYSTFGGLSKHRQFHCTLHVKKEFACKICTKSYSSLGALKMHIRTHTLPCKCHICGKAFSRPWLLQGHVRTHTGEKPFRCNHCGRAFADRSNLRAHLQTHTEIKKYACVKCGKTFSRMSLLTKHSDGSCPANTSPCV